MSVRQCSFAVVMLAVAATVGCGPGGGKLVPVTGKVTYKGEPVADASVTFIHSGGQTMPVGRTDANGAFTLASVAGAGAALGQYKVTITKAAAREGAPAAPKPEDMIKMMQGKSIPDPKALLPAKYADPDKGGLTAEVTGDKSKDNFTFDLTD